MSEWNEMGGNEAGRSLRTPTPISLIGETASSKLITTTIRFIRSLPARYLCFQIRGTVSSARYEPDGPSHIWSFAHFPDNHRSSRSRYVRLTFRSAPLVNLIRSSRFGRVRSSQILDT